MWVLALPSLHSSTFFENVFYTCCITLPVGATRTKLTLMETANSGLLSHLVYAIVQSYFFVFFWGGGGGMGLDRGNPRASPPPPLYKTLIVGDIHTS